MWLLLAATPLVLLVTYYVSFMTHEYGHSLAALILDIKSGPWPIHWGSNSIGNILFLDEVDEHVDYDTAMASGKNLAVAVVAVSGIAVNALLYLVFRFAAPLWRTSTRRLVAYSTFWLLCMEVAISTVTSLSESPRRVATCTTGPWDHISRGGGCT
jgi:membrane-associated phospholipid phosphatase